MGEKIQIQIQILLSKYITDSLQKIFYAYF